MRPATIGTVYAFSAIAAVWPMPCPQSVETNAAVPNHSPPTLVFRSLRPFSRVLRTSFLVLLLLGLVSRPAPGLGCDLLAMEHGGEVTSTSDQGHADPCAPRGDHAHAKGANTLMQPCFAGASVDASATQLVLPDTSSSPVPTPDCVPVSRLQRSVPFRPPIA
jgi:hypothetical protein